MGFMDELKKLARPYAEDEDDFDDDFDLEERPRVSRASTAPRVSAFDDTMEEPAATRPTFGRRGESKVVNLGSANGQTQVVLLKPDRYDNVSEIAEHLRNRRAVVINMETTNKDVTRRVVDFLSGCAYALDGKIKKIAVATYLVTPHNVDIVGDLIDELENSSAYL